MSKEVRKQVNPCLTKNRLIENIENLRRFWCRVYGHTRYCKLYMSNITYQELKCEMDMIYPAVACRDLYSEEYVSVLGLDIGIDDSLEPCLFVIKEDKEMKYNNDIRTPKMFVGGGVIKATNLPKKYIINKGATILFWEDDSKTIVKRGKNDNYDKVTGFLWAYFQKTSGLSKTKSNKYLQSLVDEDDLMKNN